MLTERIQRDLALLAEGGQEASLVMDGARGLIVYRQVPTAGARVGLPTVTDVVVPVPSGHPANAIDLAGLPVGSPFLARVRGGLNSQGIVAADGRQWQLASYHPHNGGGGPPYDPRIHGFDTYLDHLIAWLHRID